MKQILRSTFLLLILVIAACSHAQKSDAALAQPSPPETPYNAQGDPDVKVWVNTASGVYHCPGTRWYGNTKQGYYLTQKQAQKKGYRPAYGNPC